MPPQSSWLIISAFLLSWDQGNFSFLGLFYFERAISRWTCSFLSWIKFGFFVSVDCYSIRLHLGYVGFAFQLKESWNICFCSNTWRRCWIRDKCFETRSWTIRPRTTVAGWNFESRLDEILKVVRVFYYHSRINVDQANRLYNLKSFLEFTCGQFRCKWGAGGDLWVASYYV